MQTEADDLISLNLATSERALELGLPMHRATHECTNTNVSKWIRDRVSYSDCLFSYGRTGGWMRLIRLTSPAAYQPTMCIQFGCIDVARGQWVGRAKQADKSALADRTG